MAMPYNGRRVCEDGAIFAYRCLSKLGPYTHTLRQYINKSFSVLSYINTFLIDPVSPKAHIYPMRNNGVAQYLYHG